MNSRALLYMLEFFDPVNNFSVTLGLVFLCLTCKGDKKNLDSPVSVQVSNNEQPNTYHQYSVTFKTQPVYGSPRTLDPTHEMMLIIFLLYLGKKNVVIFNFLLILLARLWGLSGRVLDSRPRGCGFEPHQRHCVVSLSKNINPSLVQVQPRKTRPFITKDCWWDVRNQTHKQSTFAMWNNHFTHLCIVKSSAKNILPKQIGYRGIQV